MLYKCYFKNVGIPTRCAHVWGLYSLRSRLGFLVSGLGFGSSSLHHFAFGVQHLGFFVTSSPHHLVSQSLHNFVTSSLRHSITSSQF